ncbi:MAG: PAS domain-containing sensor histidine kinase [Candidatus Cloacimonadota bacterium]
MKNTIYRAYEKDGACSTNLLSPELMTNIMHNLPGIAYRCINDGDWTMLFLSEGCAKLTGYSPEELLYNKNISYDELIVPEDRELVRLAVEEGVKTRSRFKMEYRITRKDEQIIWVWEQGYAVFDDAKDTVYLDGFIADISSRKYVEEELQAITDELGYHNRLKDKFFNIIAHDLQNPIYAIISLTEFMQENRERLNIDQILDFCAQINSSANRINGHLDNLLEWSKIQTGGKRMRYTQIKLAKLVEDVLDSLRRQTVDKQIRYELSIDPEMRLYSDLRIMNSILRNLISNALKYSDQGKNVMIRAWREGGFAFIQVEDQGIGMPRSMINKIIQGEITQNRIGTAHETGNGMGLALVATYVKQLGGKLELESRVNRGTIARIMVPLSESTLLTS